MKKIYNFLFVIVFTFILLCISKNVEANSINKISMDIYVDKNGNASVTEVWNCSASQGTEVYHPYYNLGNSKITNLKVSEGTKAYTTLSSWNTSGSLSSKAYKCGINTISNGVELCWGISEYGSHTYTVKYNISNFVSALTDSQMIYWTLIPYDFSNPIGSVYIKIYTDFRISDTTDVWGYGNYGGTCYVYDGYIEMQSDGRLASDEYMTILVKFPSGTFNTSNSLDHNFDYYFNMSQEGSTAYVKSSVTFYDILFTLLGFVIKILPALFVIFISIFSIKRASGSMVKDEKGKKFSKETPYFRDIPCGNDLFRAYYIANDYNLNTKKTDLLGAIILKWIKDSIVSVDQRETGTFIKKESTAIILNSSSSNLITDQYEKKLFSMLYEASKDGVLEKKELEKWCRNHYSKILDWFDDIIDEQKKILISQGLIILEEVTQFKIFKSKKYTATPELHEEAERIYGLKRYLKEYTLIPDREAIQVQLFEEYLIFAQMLGIAKEVAKEFKDLYPEVIEQSSYSSYDNIIFIHTYSSSAATAATIAKSRAESYTSGGGGFSSGGGGGGSFGGGGGGGGGGFR